MSEENQELVGSSNCFTEIGVLNDQRCKNSIETTFSIELTIEL
jgi:hypothetical protein